MFHLLGQLASSRRETSSTGFLLLFLRLLGWGKRLSLRFGPPLPSFAALPRSLGPIVAARTCPGWRPGCARRRARGRRGAARWACAPDGASRGRRTGAGRQARGGLKVPSRRGPDDRTTAGCGRHKACQSAREERGQSGLSPVSIPSRDRPRRWKARCPSRARGSRGGNSFRDLSAHRLGAWALSAAPGPSSSGSAVEKRHGSVSERYCSMTAGGDVNSGADSTIRVL